MSRYFFALLVLLTANLAAFSARSLAPQESPQQQTLPPPAKPAAPVVVVDPAHGGADSGARGGAGIVESELVLDFARALRVTLEGQGLHVILTRENNDGPSLEARSTIINGQRDGLFISLHISSTGPAATVRTYWYQPDANAAAPTGTPATPVTDGSSTVHRGLVAWDQAQQSHSDDSKKLAELVQAQIAPKFTGSDAAPRRASLRQLRTVAAPAIAIEVSSVAVSGKDQLLRMAAPLAEAVARGVTEFRNATGPR